MDLAKAKRLGFDINLVSKPKVEPPVVPAPSMDVTINHQGIAEAIQAMTRKLEPQVIEVVKGDGTAAALVMQAIERSNQAVIRAVQSRPVGQVVDTVDLTHEIDMQTRLPIVKQLKFNYKAAE